MADSSGLIASEIGIPTGDREIPGYRAMPDEPGPFPMVLVVQEIFGVNEHIKDVCRRLAKLGYLAVAPELYVRQGDVSKLENVQEILKLVSQVPDAQVVSDLDAAFEWGANRSNGDSLRLGMTGFCWGGRIAWLYAAHNARLKAAAAWYGRLVGQSTPLQPKHPIDILDSLRVPVLGLYGGKDKSISVDTVERMREALQSAGNASEIVIYPDAGHAFFADYRPSFHKASAEDGWRRMLAWFKRWGLA